MLHLKSVCWMCTWVNSEKMIEKDIHLKKSIIALIICIFFKQRATARFSNSSTAKKGVTELSVA